MFSLFKRWRLMVVALVAGLAVLVSTTEAFAGEPGEASGWNTEMANSTPVQGRGVSEAYTADGHAHMTVWRGETNNQVWMSVDNGTPFTVGTTATYVAPTVVQWGTSGFAVFHVGTDGYVYWNRIGDPTNPSSSWSFWANASLQIRTSAPVAVTRVNSPFTNQLMMAWQGYGGNNETYSSYYNGNGWQAPVDTGGVSPSAPAIAYNDSSNAIFLGVRGTDNAFWLDRQNLGGSWQGWSPRGGGIDQQPSLAAASNGTMLAEGSAGGRPYYDQLDSNGNPSGGQGWSVDVTGWSTNYTVVLVAVGIAIFALLVGQDADTIRWKQAWHG